MEIVLTVAYLISVGIIGASVLYFSINFLFVLSEIKVHTVSLLLSLLYINVALPRMRTWLWLQPHILHILHRT